MPPERDLAPEERELLLPPEAELRPPTREELPIDDLLELAPRVVADDLEGLAVERPTDRLDGRLELVPILERPPEERPSVERSKVELLGDLRCDRFKLVWPDELRLRLL